MLLVREKVVTAYSEMRDTIVRVMKMHYKRCVGYMLHI